MFKAFGSSPKYWSFDMQVSFEAWKTMENALQALHSPTTPHPLGSSRWDWRVSTCAFKSDSAETAGTSNSKSSPQPSSMAVENPKRPENPKRWGGSTSSTLEASSMHSMHLARSHVAQMQSKGDPYLVMNPMAVLIKNTICLQNIRAISPIKKIPKSPSIACLPLHGFD